jgi:redox-regulated HSP33 family molecular chaperone
LVVPVQRTLCKALIQIGVDAVHETLEAQNPIQMDCQFCNTRYSLLLKKL